MKKKGVILFDIDYVLINTDKLRPFLIDNDWKKAKLPYKESVYPEVIKILQKIKKEYRLGIFSESNDLDYQKNKFLKSGLKKYFDTDLIFIVKSKKNSIQLIKEKIDNKQLLVMIDDRLDKLTIIKKAIPGTVTVHVSRGKYKKMKFDYQADYEVKDLNQFFNF